MGGEPSIHDGRLWLDHNDQPWFGIQLKNGYTISGHAQLDSATFNGAIADKIDKLPVYFIVDYRKQGSASATTDVGQGQGVQVDWKCADDEDMYLRISVGYAPDDVQLKDGFVVGSRVCHVSVASHKKPAVQDPMAAMASMPMGATSGNGSQSAGATGAGSATAVMEEPDQRTEWKAKLTITLANFQLPTTGYNLPDDVVKAINNRTVERKLYRMEGDTWKEAIVTSADSSTIVLDSPTANNLPMGMYLLGLRAPQP